jgi:antitoxin (DNA-binding transcriptional repressor) of toxin-antitoxin stability system
MKIITLQDLRLALGALLDHHVEPGERIVVTQDGKPVAELPPIEAPAREPRPVGLAAGEFSVPDGFDDPLPDEILRAFEGR